MLNIVNSYPENLTERQAYKLTHSQSVQKMQSASGSVIDPKSWVIFKDLDNKTGEEKTVLAVETEGEIFATISPFFINSFLDIVENFGGDCGPIKVVSLTAKSGREFIACELA